MEVQLLVNGKSTFDKIIQQIRNAKESVIIHMFIWRDDVIGRKIAEALIEAADRGVHVRIVKDILGGVFEYSEETKKSFLHQRLPFGLNIQSLLLDWFYRMKGKARYRTYHKGELLEKLLAHQNIEIVSDVFRDHSKYYIFDHNKLILGGINIEDKEWLCDCEGKAYNDYAAFIEGIDAVEALLDARKNGGEGYRDIVSGKMNDGKRADFFGNVIFENIKFNRAKDAILNRIKQTQYELTVVMAYLGEKDIMDALIELSNAGKSVTLVIPQKANIQDDLNKYWVRYMLKRTDNRLSVYLCRDMVHAKMFFIDQDYLSIGSTNFNKKAFSKLQELNTGFFTVEHKQKQAVLASIEEMINISEKVLNGKSLHYNAIRGLIEGLV